MANGDGAGNGPFRPPTSAAPLPSSTPPWTPDAESGSLVQQYEALHAAGSTSQEPHPHFRVYDPPRRPIDYIALSLRRLWGSSHTVLRFDIRQAIHVDGPVLESREVQRHRHTNNKVSQGWLQGVRGGGARLKIMQIWDFPNKDTGEPSLPWNINVGFGAKVEMDKGGHLEPLMRVESRHIGLYVLPSPFLQLHGKWPLGGTNLAINVHYRIPLLQFAKFWACPTAQLCVNFYNPVGTGFHLTPGGIEFDEHAISIGANTKLRVAAAITFPRQFPLQEGEQPVRVVINRLGLRSRVT